jgi:RNA polymerase sigma factor (sigma-70 family)
MTTTVILGILTSLIAGEISGVSPWCAKKLARWSALRRYAENPERAAIRAEELAALIESRPGNILKLLTALGFAAVGLATSLFKAGRPGSTEMAPESPPLLVLPQVALPQVAPRTATPRPARPAYDSFSEFYRHTYPLLVRYLARLDGLSGLSEDVAQATMIAACENWDSLVTYERPDSWVFSLARSKLNRSQRNERALKELQERSQVTMRPADVAEEASSDLVALHLDIASALGCLPGQRADVIRLHVLEDYSRADVAKTLSISVSSVDRELRDGLAHLRERLSSWHEPQET